MLFKSKSKTTCTDHTQEFEVAMLPQPSVYNEQLKDKQIKNKIKKSESVRKIKSVIHGSAQSHVKMFFFA